MSKKLKVLLVGWDAADWEHIHPMLDAGKLPVLESLVNRGTIGNIATLQPVLSPMLWNSVATGKQPYKHGVLGFTEPDPVSQSARPWSSQSRRTKALWNILSQSGFRTNVVNWWASYPAEKVNGCIVSNLLQGKRNSEGRRELATHSVHPVDVSELIADQVVQSQELNWQQILPFVPNAGSIDQDTDQRLSILVKHLAEMLTTHNIATAVMEHTEWDFMAVYYTAIDHFCHTFMPYYPPKLPWIAAEDFENYQHVIDGVYRFSDMTLGRLLQLAGEDVTVIVCSDHGFQSGALRLRATPNEPAGPAYWHRKYGIFVAAGPGIKKDKRVNGATLLDVAPTILKMFNLPIGQDMDGRILSEIFDLPPSHKYPTISSWDDVESKDDGISRQRIDVDPAEADELIRQFVALGYVEDAGESREQQFAFAKIEADFNLARNLLWCRKPRDAAQLLLKLVESSPWEDRFIIHAVRSLVASRQGHYAKRLLLAAFDIEKTKNLQAKSLWCEVLISLGDGEACTNVLDQLSSRADLPIGLSLLVGYCYMKLHRLEDAKLSFKKAINQHGENADALLGLSTVHLICRENAEAADAALASIGLLYNQARAHSNLGIALARSGDFERAEAAFLNALKIAPKSRRVNRWLRVLYSGPLKDPARASLHLLASADDEGNSTAVSETIELPEIDLTVIPDEANRHKILYERRPAPVNEGQLSGKTFVLVSGLPRSGTSLMMQMLEIGGLMPKTDGQRSADIDNPHGYHEWEEIKQLARKPQLFDEPDLDRLAIKVVAPLLPSLPYRHQYKVIFMDRPVDEVVTSQLKMIDRLNTEGAKLSESKLKMEMHLHRQYLLAWLEQHPRAEVLLVSYNELLEDPETWTTQIKDFVGSELLPSPDKMATAIDRQLYRNRSN